MTDAKIIETLWRKPVVLRPKIQSKPFRLDLGKSTEHTITTIRTAQGMSWLTGAVATSKHLRKKKNHD